MFNVKCVVFLLSVCVSILVAEPKLACEVAVKFERPSFIPSASDVTIRSLNFRPINAKDKNNTLEAMSDFHATRLEWVYLHVNEDEKELIDKVKQSGRVFGGASSSKSGVKVCVEPGREFVENSVLGINGEPLFMEHSRYWAVPIYSGCMNNPDYKREVFSYYKDYIDWGAEVLQRDEPGTSYRFAKNRQGCYCRHCMSEFSVYLGKKLSEAELEKLKIDNLDTFDYSNWLKINSYVKGAKVSVSPLADFFAEFHLEVSVEFYKDLRKRINDYAGRYVPFSCNNTSFQDWESSYVFEFDFAISELMMQSANPVHLYDRAKKAVTLGKVQVFGSPKTLGKEYSEEFLIDLKRKVIATSYAVGGLSRVPWDIFEQTKDGKGRYFGRPQDYSDLYGFVRANDKYLTGYDDAGGFGLGMNEERYGENKPLTIQSDEKEIYAFIRAISGSENAPVVVHLVDWSDNQEPFELVLKNDNFFRTGKLSVKMIRPTDYDKAEHGKAEMESLALLKKGEKLSAKQSDAYTMLFKDVALPHSEKDGYTTVKVPAITPWAIIVTSKK